MAPWAQHAAHHMHSDAKTHFEGPWIENAWIAHFEAAYDGRARGTKLADFFGAFVPIFVPFVDHWVNAQYHYPPGMLDALRGVLRADVPYVVVSQHDEGLTGKCEWVLARHPNVLVLSAGGYGHVPVPLFKQYEAVRADLKDTRNPRAGITRCRTSARSATAKIFGRRCGGRWRWSSTLRASGSASARSSAIRARGVT